MAICESGKADRIIPMRPQVAGQHFVFRLSSAIWPGSDEEVGATYFGVGNDSAVDAETTGEQSGSGRKTGGTRTIIMVKAKPLFSNGVNRRGRGSVVPVTSQMVWSQAVKIKIDDSQFFNLASDDGLDSSICPHGPT
jgi:hypothetical protein